MEAFRSDIEFLAAHEGTARTTLLKFNRDFLSRSVVEVIPDRPIEKEYLDDVSRRPYLGAELLNRLQISFQLQLLG